MNLPLNSRRKGYWKEFENIKKELLPLCEIFHGMPPSGWLRQNEYSSLVGAISYYHGGKSKVSKQLGYPILDFDTALDGHYVFSWYEK
jgi:hypothetical protein